MTATSGNTLRPSKEQSFAKWWEEICRFGDMDEREGLIQEAFNAGWDSRDTPETPAGGPDSWEANAKYLLDRCPHTIRVREGGGPENLMHSFVHTFTAMERKLEQPTAAKAAECVHDWSAIRGRAHECLTGCGATMDARTGAVTTPNGGASTP